MLVFLDTNILLDVLLNRPGLVAESEAAILRCEALGSGMFVAWHGLATAYYLLRRGRTEAEALLEVDRILAWARVASAGDAEARRARALGFADFEDALQAASAETCGARWLLTRDIAGSEKPLWHRRRLAEATSEKSAKCLNARPDPKTVMTPRP